MSLCPNCNTEIPNGNTVCNNCGAPVGIDGGSFDPADVKSNKVLAILSYFGILFIIPFLAAKNSKYAHFHCNQGACLFVTSLIFNIVLRILSAIAAHSTPLAIVVLLLYIVTGVFTFVLFIMGIVNASSGKAKELPIIGKFRIIK